MKKIALTGGFGAGKSLVGEILKELGFVVIDLDEIVSSLYEQKDIQGKILNEFNSLNKEEIARIVFSDSKKRKKLESILHPPALNVLWDKLSELDEELVFVEIPLLFEAGLSECFDLVIAVICSEENRVKRLEKEGVSREKVLKRLSVQISDVERVKKADFVIDNNGSVAKTREQVLSVLVELND